MQPRWVGGRRRARFAWLVAVALVAVAVVGSAQVAGQDSRQIVLGAEVDNRAGSSGCFPRQVNITGVVVDSALNGNDPTGNRVRFNLYQLDETGGGTFQATLRKSFNNFTASFGAGQFKHIFYCNGNDPNDPGWWAWGNDTFVIAARIFDQVGLNNQSYMEATNFVVGVDPASVGPRGPTGPEGPAGNTTTVPLRVLDVWSPWHQDEDEGWTVWARLADQNQSVVAFNEAPRLFVSRANETTEVDEWFNQSSQAWSTTPVAHVMEQVLPLELYRFNVSGTGLGKVRLTVVGNETGGTNWTGAAETRVVRVIEIAGMDASSLLELGIWGFFVLLGMWRGWLAVAVFASLPFFGPLVTSGAWPVGFKAGVLLLFVAFWATWYGQKFGGVLERLTVSKKGRRSGAS